MAATRGLLWAGLAMLVAMGVCSCGSDQLCEVEALADEKLGGAEEIVDCGTFTISINDIGPYPQLVAASECVEQAAADSQPFIVVWHLMGFEGPWSQAYVGLDSPVGYQVWRYGKANDGTGTYHTGQTQCDSFLRDAPCGEEAVRERLCFECMGPSDKLCKSD